MILQHAALFLFAWIFGNQVGVPVPVVPALLGAGALAGSGDLSMAVIIAVAIGASLGADLTWYGLGRWRGAKVLKMLGRLSPSAGLLVGRAGHVFAAHGRVFQLGARFLPELNAIAAGLAGATKVNILDRARIFTERRCHGDGCSSGHPPDRPFPCGLRALSAVPAAPPPSHDSRVPSGPRGPERSRHFWLNLAERSR